MPDIRLQVRYPWSPIGQSLAVEGESIYEVFGGILRLFLNSALASGPVLQRAFDLFYMK